MKKEMRVFEVKEGKTWKETFRTENLEQIYKDLAQELLNCKVFKSQYYKKMTQNSNYDGTRTITFYQNNGRSVYTVKA